MVKIKCTCGCWAWETESFKCPYCDTRWCDYCQDEVMCWGCNKLFLTCCTVLWEEDDYCSRCFKEGMEDKKNESLKS
jgi:hypothetical protein